MAETDKRIARLIDADNAPAAKIDVILAEVAHAGEGLKSTSPAAFPGHRYLPVR